MVAVGLSEALEQMLNASSSLTREGLIASLPHMSNPNGVYPPTKFNGGHFGGTGAFSQKLNCSETEPDGNNQPGPVGHHRTGALQVSLAATTLAAGVAPLAFDVKLKIGQPLVIGLLQGSVYGLIGLGLVLLYKSNRIFNFAQAEFGTVAGHLRVSRAERQALPHPLAHAVRRGRAWSASPSGR